MAKTITLPKIVQISDFKPGKPVLKGDKNPNGVFNATFSIGGDSFATSNGAVEYNHITLVLTDLNNKAISTTLRIDKYLSRFYGEVKDDILALADLLQEKGSEALSTGFSETSTEGKLLKKFSSHTKVKSTPQGQADVDGRIPLVLEWALSRSNQQEPSLCGGFCSPWPILP